MDQAASVPVPTLLFGAMDRHNLGDLLFPHIAAALLPRDELIFAGLAERDLRPFGGHLVRALAPLAAQWGDRPVRLLHVGGEILTCDAWQSAVMLLPPEQAQATIAYLAARPRVRAAWVRRTLGVVARAPYTLSRALFPGAVRVMYNSVGGVGLAHSRPALRAEVLANLRAADAVAVRDEHTFAQLQAAGIAARLMPDPAVMLAELFGPRIRARGEEGPVAEVRRVFAQGHLAVQFGAEFGDDATLDAIAVQLDRVVAATGLGVVLFRAGAAPWHDNLADCERVAARMVPGTVRIFPSLHLWDLCALIAGSRGYGGSSLHGRIVAMAFALPRVNLGPETPSVRPTKHAAFAATWEAPRQPGVVPVPAFADGLLAALAVPPARLQQTARDLVASYRAGVAEVIGTRGGPGPQ